MSFSEKLRLKNIKNSNFVSSNTISTTKAIKIVNNSIYAVCCKTVENYKYQPQCCVNGNSSKSLYFCWRHFLFPIIPFL